ncbi:MAG: sensor histidine kinase [Hahellaceae bacterium]|nr:sensor histidine kinase [Hahellaceae bacterium]
MTAKLRGSIKGSLLILLMPAAIGLMAIAWVIHGVLLERMSEAFLTSRLHDEVAFLERQIRRADGQIDHIETGSYFEDVFHHAFAISTPTQTLILPASWEAPLTPLLSNPRDGVIRIGDIIAYRETFDVSGISYTVVVSEDMSSLRSSQAELHAWTAVVSLLLVILLASIIWLGIYLAMRPALSLKSALEQLQEGEISRIEITPPEEFRPLVAQVNQLLDFLDRRLERSRQALANLSHSIKTPITAVRQILEDTQRPLDADIRQQMVSRLLDIDKQLESEMRRNRFAGPQLGKTALPVKMVRDLVWMFGRLYPEKSFELKTTLDDETRWPVEEHDLNEILGNLIDNAGKWSVHQVEVSLSQRTKWFQIDVQDDGPGVNYAEQSQLGRRGLRLDEQANGHGLGLSIVREIVEQYDGVLEFESGKGKGLRVSVRFPRLKKSES